MSEARMTHGTADPDNLPRDHRFRPNEAELKQWTEANKRARRAYSTRDDELDRTQRLYLGRVRASARRAAANEST